MAYPAPLLSSIVSTAGTLILLRQYLERARLYKIIFALQLLDMLIGQLLEFIASAAGWSVIGYKIYYFTSPLSAALLGLGVIALTGKSRLFKLFLAYVVIVTVMLGIGVARASPDPNKLGELGPFVGGQAMPKDVRVLSPPLTIPSGLIVIALALDGYRRTRSHVYTGIVSGNIVFMVAGALLRQGYGEAFLWLELIATIILAYSFVKS